MAACHEVSACVFQKEPQTEPQTEPVTEPQTEPTTEPMTEPVTEPTTEPMTEPMTEPRAEAVMEPRTEPRTEYSARHDRVTLHTDADTWREQREQRAAVMVGILIGVFALCWLPFFTTELVSPLCDCDLPTIWKSLFLWLGYSNSFFNPLIYTAFNKTYNSAFKSLFCRHS